MTVTVILLCDNALILVYLNLSNILSSDIKVLSLAKRGVPWNLLNSPGSTAVLYFNHNNSVFKKKLTNKYTKILGTRVGTIVDQKKSAEISWSSA